MLKLTDWLLDWFRARIPDPPENPRGGRPRTDKREAPAGIFWLLDNGAKWKDLPRRFGSKSAVHQAFQRWGREGVFERLLQEAGQLVEERGEYRL
ncbi:transposase [Limisphaera sp. 4302-co]|uniref:transposase n=1 Tax=Limisphaera sp. 4302-co TaxID=3400417 RepID=UPI003C137A64